MSPRSILFALALLLTACGGNGGPAEPTGAAPGNAGGGRVTGDGSDLCLRTADLPGGYLPLTGSDNTSNARANVFGDASPEAQRAADALVASWAAYPEGGASLDDKTADCSIFIFETTEMDAIYAWYADGYPARQAPEPTVEPVPKGAPGEDPRLFLFAANEYSSRESYTYVFRVANVIASVGVDGAEGAITADDLIPLAESVHSRIEAAAS